MPQPPARQFSGIFVSYRRDDSSGHAGRLFDRLSAHFGNDQIFMDIDHIEPGEDFVQVIEKAVGSCEILIAIIGRHWLPSSDASSRRLDNPNDFVRLEIAAALNRDIRVIPVLVQGATMPTLRDLPDDLSRLSRRHGLELSDLRWQRDVDQLIGALEKILAERAEAHRRAMQEEEARQREETEARKKEEAQRLVAEKLRREEVEGQLREEVEHRRREAEKEVARRRTEGDTKEKPTNLATTIPPQPHGSLGCGGATSPSQIDAGPRATTGARPQAAASNTLRVAITLGVLLLISGGVLLSVFIFRSGEKRIVPVNQQSSSSEVPVANSPTSIAQQSTPTPADLHRKLTDAEATEVDQALKRGDSQRHVPNYDQAETEYREALRINPGEARAYYGLGSVLVDRGFYKEALVEFKRAIELAPKDAKSHLGLGMAYLMTGNKAGAEEEYRALQALKPVYANDLREEIRKH